MGLKCILLSRDKNPEPGPPRRFWLVSSVCVLQMAEVYLRGLGSQSVGGLGGGLPTLPLSSLPGAAAASVLTVLRAIARLPGFRLPAMPLLLCLGAEPLQATGLGIGISSLRPHVLSRAGSALSGLESPSPFTATEMSSSMSRLTSPASERLFLVTWRRPHSSDPESTCHLPPTLGTQL